MFYSPRKKKSKFNNKITFVGTERFHSQLEAEHYKRLLYLEKLGYVKDIVRQPPYKIYIHSAKEEFYLNKKSLLEVRSYTDLVSFVRHFLKLTSAPKRWVCTYYADFKFWDNRTNKERVSDSKGLDTAYSKLKRKMVLLQYDIKVEVWKKDIKI